MMTVPPIGQKFGGEQLEIIAERAVLVWKTAILWQIAFWKKKCTSVLVYTHLHIWLKQTSVSLKQAKQHRPDYTQNIKLMIWIFSLKHVRICLSFVIPVAVYSYVIPTPCYSHSCSHCCPCLHTNTLLNVSFYVYLVLKRNEQAGEKITKAHCCSPPTRTGKPHIPTLHQYFQAAVEENYHSFRVK